jgi:hypothetical protein
LNSEIISILDQEWSKRFPKRLTRKQKDAFLQELETRLQSLEFETQRINSRFFGFKNKNLITRCEHPEYIFLAHYDTATIIPFWGSLLFRFFGHTRQITASGVLLLLALLFSYFLSSANHWQFIIGSAVAGIFFISLISFFIPNPSNREDNSSGVIGLIALADWIKKNPGMRDKVQFAFLDNEEWGLLGSMDLKIHWDQLGQVYSRAIIISLDCISRGGTPLVIYHRNDRIARLVLPYIKKHFPTAKMIDLGFIPVSDNYSFRQSNAIDISLADASIIPGGFLIPKVHTPQDNDFYPQKVARLVRALTDCLENDAQKDREMP